MTGADLRAARERLGATHQQIAESARVRTADVEAWESFEGVPRKHRFAVDLALWTIECEQALARSGLAECEQILRWHDQPWEVNADSVARHMSECALCATRGAYVEGHVRPMPVGGNPLQRLHGLAARLTGWMRSAVAGAMMLLMMGGFGVLVLFGRAVSHQDLTYAGYALGLFGLLIVSGAAGGIVHFWTAPIRRKGAIGYYASYVLTVHGYLLVVFGCFTLAQLLLGDAAVAEGELPVLTEPVAWVILLIMGAVFGVVLGRQFRDKKTVPADVPPRRQWFSFRTVGLTILMAVGLGLGYLARTEVPLTPEEWEAALPGLEEAVRQRPVDPDARRELAWALLNLNRYDEARPALRDAVRLNPDNSVLLNALGWVDMQAGDVSKAIPLFEKAIAIDPDNTIAHQNLAWGLYRLGRIEEADSAYRVMISGDPNVAKTNAAFGWVLIAGRRLDEAEEQFRQALRIDPTDASYHRGLAIALMQSGQPQEALASLREATLLIPEDPALWGELGFLAHLVGEFDESAAALDRARELDPDLFATHSEPNAILEASRRGQFYETASPELSQRAPSVAPTSQPRGVEE